MPDLLPSGAVRAWSIAVDGVFDIAKRSIDAQHTAATAVLRANKVAFDVAATSFRAVTLPVARTAAAQLAPEPAPVVEAAEAPAAVTPAEPAPVAETPVVPDPVVPDPVVPAPVVTAPVVTPPARARAAKAVRRPATTGAATPAKPRARRASTD